jgi:hypothetical protein
MAIRDPWPSADAEPIRLKTVDAPADVVGIGHMATIRQNADDAHALLSLVSRGWGDPVETLRRVRNRLVEHAELTGRAVDSGEDLMRAIRRQGV